MKTPARALAAVLLFSLVLLVGCDGAKQATQPLPSPSPAASSEVVLGSWQVPGQSAMQYVLTFTPDGKYSMVYKGVATTGDYAVEGTTVALTGGGESAMRLRYVKGDEMQKDQLIEDGGVIWARI
jgi:hypothetical protein